MKHIPIIAALIFLSACSFNRPYAGSAGEAVSANLPPAATAEIAPNSGAAGDELLSAQAAYRAAIQQQNSSDSHIGSLQRKLQNAEQRKAEAEADISRLRTELHQASEAKTATDSATQAASQRLNAAWDAARQAGLVQ